MDDEAILVEYIKRSMKLPHNRIETVSLDYTAAVEFVRHRMRRPRNPAPDHDDVGKRQIAYATSALSSTACPV